MATNGNINTMEMEKHMFVVVKLLHSFGSPRAYNMFLHGCDIQLAMDDVDGFNDALQ